MEKTLPIDWLKLESFTENTASNGLMDGKTGTVLLLLVLSDFEDEYGDRAIEILSDAFTAMTTGDGPLNLSFGYGLTGLAYVINKFRATSVISNSIDAAFLIEIDKLILNGISLQIDLQNLGFMQGVAGNLYYLTERSFVMPQYKTEIQNIIAKLYLNAIRDSDGLRFDAGKLHTNLNMKGFERHFNLSLSDGLTGMITVLLHIYRFYPDIRYLKVIIEDAIKFVLTLEREVCVAEKRVCFFPTIVSREKAKRAEKTEFYNSRLGWCIGDLSISLMLCRAGKFLNNPEWLAKGNAVAEYTLHRKTPELNKIDNSAMCHGASGVAAMYKCLAELTGNQLLLQEGYEFWMQKALSDEYEQNDVKGDLLNGKIGMFLAAAERSEDITHDSWGDLFLL